ncbi:hypothetical protein BDF22DRAFT_679656 [Syncephalis plumigaleata]|nr:hypothetical protein BDF22DRAFT_679656 [Syncephalis plumigaleata]
MSEPPDSILSMEAADLNITQVLTSDKLTAVDSLLAAAAATPDSTHSTSPTVYASVLTGDIPTISNGGRTRENSDDDDDDVEDARRLGENDAALADGRRCVETVDVCETSAITNRAISSPLSNGTLDLHRKDHVDSIASSANRGASTNSAPTSSRPFSSPFSSLFGGNSRSLPISPLAQPPANANQLNILPNGVHHRQQLYTPGYHHAELVHMSIYAPDLLSVEDETEDIQADPSTDIDELQERQQVVYCYDRIDLLTDPALHDRPNDNTCSMNSADGSSTRKQQKMLWDMRLRKIGLARALAEFCGSFTDEPLVDNVHTQRHRWSIMQLEPGYWVLTEIALGRYVRPMRDDKHRFEVEYIESSVDDACVRETILNGYQSFRLRYGTLASIFEEQGRIKLNQQLIRHYDLLIPEWEFDRRDIHIALNGIHYTPMSRTSRLSVDQLLTDVRTRLDQVSQTMLLWRDTLVSSDIADIEETRALYRYLIDQYVPADELKGARSKGGRYTRKKVRKVNGSNGSLPSEHTNSGHESTSSLYSFWHSTNFLKTITPSFWTRSTSNDDSITSDVIEDNEIPPIDMIMLNNITSPALSRETSEGNGPDRGVTVGCGFTTRITTITGGVTSLGRFLTGPMRSRDATGQVMSSPPNNSNSEAPPIIYVGSPNRPHHLIVYQYPPQLLLVMLVPVDQAPHLTSIEFYRTLSDHIVALVEAVHYRMAQERRNVERAYVDRVKSYRFIYLDRLSLALRTTISIRRMRNDIRECLLRMHEAFESDPDIRELCDRLSVSNRWVLARRDTRREVYFVVDRKDATLVQVEEEFRRLSAVDLGQIVMDR